MNPDPVEKSRSEDTSWFAWLTTLLSSDTSSKPAGTGSGGEYHGTGSDADASDGGAGGGDGGGGGGD